jgi:hypothetical protein
MKKLVLVLCAGFLAVSLMSMGCSNCSCCGTCGDSKAPAPACTKCGKSPCVCPKTPAAPAPTPAPAPAPVK